MKSLSEIGYNQQHQVEETKSMVIPENIKLLIAKIFTSFKGMYNFSSIKDENDLRLKQQEMTRAIFDNRYDIGETNVNDALKFLRTKGGKWMPTVPEFIQLCLGQHEEQRKAPEHVWFDAGKAIPKQTQKQIQQKGIKGIAACRAAMRGENPFDILDEK